ncbi:hypothetical protein Tcan_10722 [Toxocara canis]|uniref:Uncharacterized protein n=1 Tax=Toxocara canis TaxID=6265 RepID=A0A0B2VXW0_TOXCA|nr:hypothetical protein Tcan_10722 [Toxocara canis]
MRSNGDNANGTERQNRFRAKSISEWKATATRLAQLFGRKSYIPIVSPEKLIAVEQLASGNNRLPALNKVYSLASVLFWGPLFGNPVMRLADFFGKMSHPAMIVSPATRSADSRRLIIRNPTKRTFAVKIFKLISLCIQLHLSTAYHGAN